jgi:nucleotide-binding universal stress UspA family protein
MDTIFACIDGSTVNNAVCDAARWASERLAKPVTLLHTLEKQAQHGADTLSGNIGLGAQIELLEQMAQLDQERARLAMQYGKSLLETAVARLGDHHSESVNTLLRHGDFVETLVELESQARLMVVGKVGLDHGGQFSAVGSHIETLLRQVHTSVLIANQVFEPPRDFMLAYDGRDTADRSLARIIEGGLLGGLPCHLVMVKSGDRAREDKLQAAETRLKGAGFHVTTALLEGPIFETLQAYQQSQQVSLLVMGAFAHSKVRHLFLGSNTIRMLENATAPLIVLR